MLIIGSFLASHLHADEGLWLIHKLEKQVYERMRELGLELTPEQIYHEEHASLSQAILLIDGGRCTGAIVSGEGLFMTNHHCALGDIEVASRDGVDLLEQGFWADHRFEEIPVKGKTVQVLHRVVEVTDEAKREFEQLERVGFRGERSARVARILRERYQGDGSHTVRVASFWSGSLYYLYFYREYQDIRLVAAPPLSMAGFGGEFDNWGWPQQKADFALYRIYTAPDGAPADYDVRNVPMRPESVLPLSTKGFDAGDFLMLAGYPAKTNRYISSFALDELQNVTNRVNAEVRRMRLDIWREFMDRDEAIRRKYTKRYFQMSNITDLAKWENEALIQFDLLSKRRAEELELREWIKLLPERTVCYGGLLDSMALAYEARREQLLIRTYYREAWALSSDLLNNARRFVVLANTLSTQGRDFVLPNDSLVVDLLEQIDRFLYSRTDMILERFAFEELLPIFLKQVPLEYMGEYLQQVVVAADFDATRIAAYIYGASILGSREQLHAFFSVPRTTKEILNDPSVGISQAMEHVRKRAFLAQADDSLSVNFEKMEVRYKQAIYQMRQEKGVMQYPDANTTMRLSYGRAEDVTEMDHYLERVEEQRAEFSVLPEFEALLRRGARGDWYSTPQQPINFLADLDITGGSSGSPVLNGKGELIGLAFDGNREGIATNIYFHPALTKAVCVDVRYILWILDKYANAHNILEELGFEVEK